MMPSPAVDFNFESTNTTPYATAPSTPQRFPTFFYSAPTSPTHQFLLINSSPASPTDPLKKPLFEDEDEDEDDFAFDFSGRLEPPSISAADELFHCGKIKPLKPVSNHSRFTEKAFSPRSKKKDLDPFTSALNQTAGDQNPSKRGREKTTTTRDKASSSSFRISDILSDEETHHQKNSITHSSSSSLTWYNKWNLKNLLLFRSASEGSARRIKEPVNKYSRIRKSDEDEVVKKSSFRSRDGRRVMRKVSAHEIHYTANRAVAEEMKKKTFLPYKSGLLGCLGFHNNGGSVHEISRGINCVMRQRGD
ncbi:Protein of unknown function DUF1645 [Cynara cardunculus var. scolymus]|uniref:Uncharacterized protein n=2 Tax=Cynara cardunculus var. scolymus TaxID=59895 RepID=A0A118K6J8_CYNCS|nr:Protein of unknown function DUF1645 [Cynara cardunculus var. scolymus]